VPSASPLVSVITVVLNGRPTIERTVRSVLAQTWRPLDYLIIDGGSTDGTLETLERYRGRLGHIVSEPDQGIADAFNKGVRLARGDLLQLTNADDWLEPEQIAHGVRALREQPADFVFGDLVYHRADGSASHRVRGDAGYEHRIGSGMPDLNHPTVLARRRVFERIGGFDGTLRYAMDYDWLLRAHRAGLVGAYVPEIVGHMTLGGAADRDWHRALIEVMRVSRRHGCPAARAQGLLLYRLVKGAGRRALVHLGASGLHDRLRQRINPRLGAPG
jgi:glycosyltransferase involved in cell wall biosynthesis